MNRGDCTIAVLTVLPDTGADPWSNAHKSPFGECDEGQSSTDPVVQQVHKRRRETADVYYGFALDAAEDASVATLAVTPHRFIDDALAGSRYQKSGRRCASAAGPREQVGGGRRGQITEFSRQSRRRLQTALASVPRGGYRPDRLLFVTLTYHHEWPADAAGLKAHLGAWRKRIERRYGNMPMFWRFEYQGRGAPHWHLLVFAPEHLVPELSGEPQEFPFALALTAAWHELVAPGDVAHALHGVNIRQANSWNAAMYYLSKYMAKPESLSVGGSMGRVWGIWHKDLLGITWRRWNLSYLQFVKLRRVLRRACRYRKADAELRGMVCFVNWFDVRRLLNFYELALPVRGSPSQPGRCGAVFPYVRPTFVGDKPVSTDLSRSGQPALFYEGEYATSR